MRTPKRNYQQQVLKEEDTKPDLGKINLVDLADLIHETEDHSPDKRKKREYTTHIKLLNSYMEAYNKKVGRRAFIPIKLV